MASLSDSVLDAALNYISTNCNKAQVRNASSAVLVNNVALDGSNFGSAGNGASSNGRRKQCLVSSASDMKAIAVSSGGSATKVALLHSSVVHVVASIASAPVNLGSSDSVNLAAFYVQINDPT